MDTFFSNKCITLLIRGSIDLLILSAIIAAFLGTPVMAHAQMSRTRQDTNQAFNVFCSFYYKYSQDPHAYQDTELCQQLSNSFSSVLMQDSPNGYSAWPTQASLFTLAQKGLLLDSQTLTHVARPQAFVYTIRTNLDLQTLVSGKGNSNKHIAADPAFLYTLWYYTNTNTPIIIDRAITPTCANTNQSYYYSDTWAFVGPELLKQASQNFIQTLDIQKIYNELRANGHCSLAVLSEKMYGAADANEAYQLEKDLLSTVQSQFQDSKIYHVSSGLTWILSQTNKTLVDDWVSFAILSNPNELTPINDNVASYSSPVNNKVYPHR
jgi:hypothetical protein